MHICFYELLSIVILWDVCLYFQLIPYSILCFGASLRANLRKFFLFKQFFFVGHQSEKVFFYFCALNKSYSQFHDEPQEYLLFRLFSRGANACLGFVLMWLP